MNENRKIDEAINYAIQLLKNLDPDDMYNFEEIREKILGIIGYMTMLKV